MSDNNICCGVFEKITEEGFDFPFEKPLYIDRDAKDLKIGDMAVWLFKKTSSGRISQSEKNTMMLYIEFCPFCGKGLRELEAAP